jgi:hypothetical protein
LHTREKFFPAICIIIPGYVGVAVDTHPCYEEGDRAGHESRDRLGWAERVVDARCEPIDDCQGRRTMAGRRQASAEICRQTTNADDRIDSMKRGKAI